MALRNELIYRWQESDRWIKKAWSFWFSAGLLEKNRAQNLERYKSMMKGIPSVGLDPSTFDIIVELLKGYAIETALGTAEFERAFRG